MVMDTQREIDRLDKEIREVKENENQAIAKDAWDYATKCLGRVRELEAKRDGLLARLQVERVHAFVTVEFKLFGSSAKPSMNVRADILWKVFDEQFKKLALPEHVKNAKYWFETKEKARIDNDEQLHSILATAKTVTIFVDSDQKDYSHLTLDDLKKRGIMESAVPLDMGLEHKDSIREMLQPLLAELKDRNAVFGDIGMGNESTRREFISPVLVRAARPFAPDMRIKPKRVSSGDVGRGKEDYVFIYKEITVAVTEAKKDDIDAGVVQNVAQLRANQQVCQYALPLCAVHYLPTCDNDENELDNDEKEAWGIVTTGNQYAFTRLFAPDKDGRQEYQRSKVYVISPSGAGFEVGLAELLRALRWLLDERKANMDRALATKAARVGGGGGERVGDA